MLRNNKDFSGITLAIITGLPLHNITSQNISLILLPPLLSESGYALFLHFCFQMHPLSRSSNPALRLIEIPLKPRENLADFFWFAKVGHSVRD